MIIPIYKPYLKNREKEYVNQCLDSTWISSKGEFIAEFEKHFGNFIVSPHVTAVCNGTVAIHLALVALGIKPGDEIIVPTFTYVASVNTILQAGGVPVFVDSLESTLQMDPDDVIRKISPRTKAVMAVHLYGLPCDMEKLVKICNDHNLFLIEDCAEAFGSFYNQQHVGTFGDISTFSFFGNKTITTGEGGMVVAKSKELIEKAFHLKNQGVSKDREYWHDHIAFNYRMTNICAAIGLAQIEQAETILEKKRKIAAGYHEQLKGLPLRTHDEVPNTRHSYWMCSVILDSPEYRQPLRDFLKNKGIETRPFFHPSHTLPIHRQDTSFPVAENMSSRGINLPSYPDLSEENVTYITDNIKLYFSGRA